MGLENAAEYIEQIRLPPNFFEPHSTAIRSYIIRAIEVVTKLLPPIPKMKIVLKIMPAHWHIILCRLFLKELDRGLSADYIAI